jgi:hypothetical protein
MKGHAFIRAEALLRSFANNPGLKAGVKKRALAQTNDLIFTSRRKCKELRKRNEL